MFSRLKYSEEDEKIYINFRSTQKNPINSTPPSSFIPIRLIFILFPICQFKFTSYTQCLCNIDKLLTSDDV